MDFADERPDGPRAAEAEHRLKTALAVITGWAITLDDRWELLTEERRREGASVIRRASEELARQAAGMLDDVRAELRGLEDGSGHVGTNRPAVIDLGRSRMERCPPSATGATSRS